MPRRSGPVWMRASRRMGSERPKGILAAHGGAVLFMGGIVAEQDEERNQPALTTAAFLISLAPFVLR
jgi:hypothetical protein